MIKRVLRVASIVCALIIIIFVVLGAGSYTSLLPASEEASVAATEQKE